MILSFYFFEGTKRSAKRFLVERPVKTPSVQMSVGNVELFLQVYYTSL